jgi:hypothetical protein
MFSLEAYFNVLQGLTDSVDPMNVADNLVAEGKPILLSTFVGDTVIPNNAYPQGLVDESQGFNAFPAPLAGSDPYAALLGAVQTPATAGAVTVQGVHNTRYIGASHGTPVLPRPDSGSNVTADQAAQQTQTRKQIFAEMIGQTTSFFLSGGTSYVVTDSSVIESAE